MFHTLTNVQDRGAVSLQQHIENQNGGLCVGLRSITYTVGWYNVGPQESLSWRRSGEVEVEGTFEIPPGFYKASRLLNLLRRVGDFFILRLNHFNARIRLQINNGWEMRFTNGLLLLLNLDDGFKGTWLDSGTYDGDRAVNFAGTKRLGVDLKQLSTTNNFVDGAPSTLLAVVGLGPYSYGDTNTIRFETPEFKRLTRGNISELKITIHDDTGKVLDNYQQSISVVLEIRKCNEGAPHYTSIPSTV